MVILSADVTDGIKDLIKELIRTGQYKSQSEVIRDAVRELAFKYKIEARRKPR